MPKKFVTLVSLALALSSAVWIKQGPVPARTASDTLDDAFIVGVLRPDGVIVPFAQYAHQKWTNPWHSSQSDDQADQSDTIADLPKPWFESLLKESNEWYFWSASGEATTLRTSRTVQVCSHCQQVWGLLSDYPHPKEPEKNACVRNLGIVLSEKRQARTMEKLTADSPDWKQVTTFIGPEFDLAERVGLSGLVDQQYSAQIPAAEERAKVPLLILNLYRSQLADGGQLLFYFEASKEYAKPSAANDAACNNISLLGGWVLRDAQGNLTLLDFQFEPTDCDMKEGGRILPFAIVQVNGKTFAIVEEDSYEGEGYNILEIREDSVHHVLDTYAGSC